MSRPARFAVIVSVSALLVLGLAGSSRLSGPVLWTIGDTSHGVHATDLVAVALWGMAVVAVWRARP